MKAKYWLYHFFGFLFNHFVLVLAGISTVEIKSDISQSFQLLIRFIGSNVKYKICIVCSL